MRGGTRGPAVELRGTAEGCTVRGSTVCDGGGAGVLCCAAARGSLADNTIARNGGAGIEVVGHGSRPVVRGNRLHDGRATGLLVRSGGGGEFVENDARRNRSSAVEFYGCGGVLLEKNKLCESQSGVGILLHGGGCGGCGGSSEGEAVRIVGNEISGHPIAGIEIGPGSSACVERNTVHHCKQVGLLLAGGGGTIRRNRIYENTMAGIECSGAGSDGLGNGWLGGGELGGGGGGTLLVEGNTIFKQTGRGGVGIHVRNGGGGSWNGNTIKLNSLGMLFGSGAAAQMMDNEVCDNTLAGVRVDEGAHGLMRDCRIHRNGRGRVSINGRRGERTHGDDSGAGETFTECFDCV